MGFCTRNSTTVAPLCLAMPQRRRLIPPTGHRLPPRLCSFLAPLTADAHFVLSIAGPRGNGDRVADGAPAAAARRPRLEGCAEVDVWAAAVPRKGGRVGGSGGPEAVGLIVDGKDRAGRTGGALPLILKGPVHAGKHSEVRPSSAAAAAAGMGSVPGQKRRAAVAVRVRGRV